MKLEGKRVLVVGLGKSGVASALFLQQQGAKVTVSDSKQEDQLRNEIPVLLDKGITVESGGHGERTFRQQDLIVISPGVPVNAPALRSKKAASKCWRMKRCGSKHAARASSSWVCRTSRCEGARRRNRGAA